MVQLKFIRNCNYRRYFEMCPQVWIAKDVGIFQEKEEFSQMLADRSVVCIIGVDAYLTANLLKGLHRPFMSVFVFSRPVQPFCLVQASNIELLLMIVSHSRNAKYCSLQTVLAHIQSYFVVLI